MKKLNESSRLWIVISICFIIGYLLSAIPTAASEPIEFGIKWDANTEAYLEGYEIYLREGDSGSTYKMIGEVYVDELEDPDNPWLIITNLYNGVIYNPESTIKMNELADGNTYHFALAAFDIYGNISEFSEEFCVEVDGSSVTKCRAANSGDDSGGSGLEDLVDLEKLGCFISALNYEDRYNSNASINNFFIACILIIGLVGWRNRKNIR